MRLVALLVALALQVVFRNPSDPSIDTSVPVVTVQVPTTGPTYDAGSASTLSNMSGISSVANGIAICRWSNSLGGSGTATTSGNGAWTIPGILLVVGSNVITISCQSSTNVTGTAVLTVTRSTSAWVLAYTPYTYPHPLQTTYVQAACVTTRAASTNVQSDVQAAVNLSTDGDCVTVPVGTGAVSWATSVSWSNKNIQLIGPGASSLTVTCSFQCVSVTTTVAPGKPFRVSGFRFTNTGAADLITCNSSQITTATSGIRVDHVILDQRSASFHGFICNGGINWGVADHITCGNGTVGFICTYFGAYTQNDFNTKNRCAPTGNNECMGYDSWALKGLDFGSPDAFYVEDATCNYPNSGLPFINDMEFGARMVFRFSTCNGGIYQSHSARSINRGGNLQSEIYRVTMDAMNSGQFRAMGILRGGAFLGFENTVAGYSRNSWDVDGQREVSSCSFSGSPLLANDGTHAWDGNIEASGWPGVDVIGRGAVTGVGTSASGQTWAPLRSWSNGTTATCATGGSCNNTTNVALNPACGSALATYIKPHSAPHTNGQWDYQNFGDGVIVVDNLIDLPLTCTPGDWAWVRLVGSWNTLGQSGLGYRCP